MHTSPVLELQKQAGASVGEAHGWYLPSAYSSLAEEYEAATEGVGLVDRSYVGRLMVTGKDGLDLLNRLSTNNLASLAVGQMMGTVLTSNKGRIIDLLFVLRLDNHLLVLTSPESRQKVMEWVDFYTFTEDVAVKDVTDETAMLTAVGPKSASLLEALSGQKIASLPCFGSASARVGDVEATVVRTDFAGLPGYDIIAPSTQARRLWRALLDAGAPACIKPAGMDALEVVRVEQGIPVFGSELSEDHNPLEANLTRFISFNKGCYVGQEVVARLNTYKKVQAHLVGLSWESKDAPAPGSALLLGGKKVGTLTSAVRSPRRAKGVGMGYVKKAQAKTGTQLTATSADGEVVVTVKELPV